MAEAAAGLGEVLRRAMAPVPPTWRQPPEYRRWRAFLRRAQWWPAERIADWQGARLAALVRTAYHRTAGYRELYRAAGVEPGDIRTVEDVRRLPTVDKRTLQDNLEAFSVPGAGRTYLTTGGSTGIPFGFYQSRRVNWAEKAFMHEGWGRAGWRLGPPSAVLRGAFIGSADRVWRWDRFARELHLSTYQLTAAGLPAYLDVLRRFAPRSVQAYPSAATMLADLVADTDAEPVRGVDVLLLGSENVYPWQLDRVCDAFPGARPFAWYGHAEKAVLAPWCEHARVYHAWPFYGITEVLRADGNEAASGETGEVVGTSFLNRYTLFIRYRTADVAEKGEPCAACGRAFPVLARIDGRRHEFIVTGAGRQIAMTAINMHDDLFDPLRQFQFYQERPGAVEFRYVARAPLPRSGEASIRAGLQAKLGADVELSMRAVPRIPAAPSGKQVMLEQRLPTARGEA